MKQALAVVMAVLLAGGAWIGLGRSLSAQEGFPASAVIRGENIRLRADPALASDVLTVMQRGDAITITGELTAADNDQFYPVELATGDAGWVRAVFVDPQSIVPIAEPPPAAEEERPARRNRDQAAEETPAAEPAQDDTRANRRNRDQQQEETTPAAEAPTEAPAAEAATPAPAEAAPTEAAPAEQAPAEETPTEEAPAETTAALAGEGEQTTDPFTLEPGRYRVIATMNVAEASEFNAVLRGPNEFRESIFKETIDSKQEWTAETNVRIREAGDYEIKVTGATEPWTIEFVPA